MSVLVQDFPVIKCGADFLATMPLTSETVTPEDVTFYCPIQRHPGAPILAEVQMSWDGETLHFFLPNQVTSKLPATGNLGNPVTTAWIYSLFVTHKSDGSRVCLSEGSVRVDP